MRSKKMNVEIVEREESKTAGFHLVGPWEVTAPEGFDKLVAWTSKHNVMGPWMGVYHGNPRAVPAEELRIETVIGVPTDFELPEGSEGARLSIIPAGTYAMNLVHVNDGDFTKPWYQFFDEWLPDSGYVMAEGPCFDHYLNDGSQSGEWDIELYIPVSKAD
jgi:DNA gyrase inhibitor